MKIFIKTTTIRS